MKTILMVALIALLVPWLLLVCRLRWQRWRADERQQQPILRLPYNMARTDRDSWRHYLAAALRGLEKGGGK